MKKERMKKRVEQDALGRVKIPSNAYYGSTTQRALNVFKVSHVTFQEPFVRSYILIKRASVISNLKLKKIDKQKARAIVKACDFLLKENLKDQFSLDVFQSGAGTAENMNVNEVIANKALEIMGKKKGDYKVIHPNDHVNLSQSTNDTFHVAMHLTALKEIENELLPNLEDLEKALRKKGKEFKNIQKSGRTHLRDAVPMTLGQEFTAFADVIQKNIKHIKENSGDLRNINLGGTAIGTGLNAGRRFSREAIKELNKSTKLDLKPSKNMIAGSWNLEEIAAVSASLRVLALDLIKVANDLRLLSSGPATGFDEIKLPAVQPGSSIMPGKVNPSVAEMVDMVGFQVIGNDTAVAFAIQAGQLQLNVMMPVIVYNLLYSIEILSNGVKIFTAHCIKGITPNEKKCREYLEKNPIIVTALTPYVGYKKAALLVQKAYKQDISVKNLVLKEKILSKKEAEKVFDVKKLTVRTL